MTDGFVVNVTSVKPSSLALSSILLSIILAYPFPRYSGFINSRFASQVSSVIFLTAKDDKDIILEILKDGPTGYLLKTTAPILLKHNIKNFFDGKEVWWKDE